jgi:hypothetical protein
MIDYISRVEQAIAKAERQETKLTESQLNPHILPGMSGKKSRVLLNELVQPDIKYLEVGVYVGSTFISACYKNNPISAQSIDLFAEVGTAFTVRAIPPAVYPVATTSFELVYVAVAGPIDAEPVYRAILNESVVKLYTPFIRPVAKASVAPCWIAIRSPPV